MKRIFHPLYNTWRKLRSRCNNKNNQDYKYYGARGIRVCPRWDDFLVFVADMGDRPSPKHTIERIDYTKGYNKENCTWATITEQNRNKTSLKYAYHGGELVCAAEWARRVGVSHKTALKYLSRGKSNAIPVEITDHIAERARKHRGTRCFGAGSSPAPGIPPKG